MSCQYNIHLNRYVLVKYGHRGILLKDGIGLKLFNLLYIFLNVFLLFLSHANIIGLTFRKDWISGSKRLRFTKSKLFMHQHCPDKGSPPAMVMTQMIPSLLTTLSSSHFLPSNLWSWWSCVDPWNTLKRAKAKIVSETTKETSWPCVKPADLVNINT